MSGFECRTSGYYESCNVILLFFLHHTHPMICRTCGNFENVHLENVHLENVHFENVHFENVHFENVHALVPILDSIVSSGPLVHTHVIFLF